MKKGNKGYAFLEILMFVVIVVVGIWIYAESNKVKTEAVSSKASSDSSKIIEPRDYGNGVYSFNVANENLELSLSSFMEKNKSLEIVVATLRSDRGIDKGRFDYVLTILTRPKK